MCKMRRFVYLGRPELVIMILVALVGPVCVAVVMIGGRTSVGEGFVILGFGTMLLFLTAGAAVRQVAYLGRNGVWAGASFKFVPWSQVDSVVVGPDDSTLALRTTSGKKVDLVEFAFDLGLSRDRRRDRLQSFAAAAESAVAYPRS